MAAWALDDVIDAVYSFFTAYLGLHYHFFNQVLPIIHPDLAVAAPALSCCTASFATAGLGTFILHSVYSNVILKDKLKLLRAFSQSDKAKSPKRDVSAGTTQKKSSWRFRGRIPQLKIWKKQQKELVLKVRLIGQETSYWKRIKVICPVTLESLKQTIHREFPTQNSGETHSSQDDKTTYEFGNLIQHPDNVILNTDKDLDFLKDGDMVEFEMVETIFEKKSK
mmetsp:Transcript_28530/g.37326  ORF Transcript_28530/g.37326 Transcript_28530/m.37326 type:complete len:223 (-) Transcript_28530:335-1003(-)